MPGSRELYEQMKRQQQAERDRLAQEAQTQRAREEAEQRRLAAQQASERKAQEEVRGLEVERGKQFMKNLGVKSEMKDLARAVGGRARVAEENGGTSVTLRFNEETEIYGTRVSRAQQTEILSYDEVKAEVLFSDKHEAVAISVNGTRVTTKEELQAALAESALQPNHEKETVREPEHEFHRVASQGHWGENQ